MKYRFFRHAALTAAAAILPLTWAGVASAQSTLTLDNANASTLRGGTYASTNYGRAATLETMASSDASSVRRTLLKFDTHTTLALGTPIASATLTFTVANGGAEVRSLSAYSVTASYDEFTTNWNIRKTGYNWSTPGGALGARYAVASVPTAADSKVTMDVTALVAAVVRGDFDPTSRYVRIMLVDEGAASTTSLKQFYSNDAADATVRPTLTITTGTATPPSAPPVSTGPVSLRVLQWNTHHGGYGTDGVYNPDRLLDWAVRMQPDVIMFNEIEKYTGWGNRDQPAIYAQMMTQKTGKTWYYHFAQEFGQWTANGKGNLILSTYPFTSTNNYALLYNGDRSIGEAQIMVNGRNITLVITHLDPNDANLRLTQAKEVTGWAAGQAENRILTGDMNAWPDQTSIAHFNTFYNDSWTVATRLSTALAFSGNTGQTKSGRIDYIFYSKNAPNLVVKSSQVYDTRDAKGVMPSDHRPVVTTFEVR